MRFRTGAEGADFRAPARSPTPAHGPRFAGRNGRSRRRRSRKRGVVQGGRSHVGVPPRTARAGHHPEAPALLPVAEPSWPAGGAAGVDEQQQRGRVCHVGDCAEVLEAGAEPAAVIGRFGSRGAGSRLRRRPRRDQLYDHILELDVTVLGFRGSLAQSASVDRGRSTRVLKDGCFVGVGVAPAGPELRPT